MIGSGACLCGLLLLTTIVGLLMATGGGVTTGALGLVTGATTWTTGGAGLLYAGFTCGFGLGKKLDHQLLQLLEFHDDHPQLVMPAFASVGVADKATIIAHAARAVECNFFIILLPIKYNSDRVG